MEATRIKPFPWMCMECREKTVTPVCCDYALPAVHDGVTHELTLHNVAVPTCARCGSAVITSDISESITAELRRVVGLLPRRRFEPSAKRLESPMLNSRRR